MPKEAGVVGLQLGEDDSTCLSEQADVTAYDTDLSVASFGIREINQSDLEANQPKRRAAHH